MFIKRHYFSALAIFWNLAASAVDVQSVRCRTEFAAAPFLSQHEPLLGPNEVLSTPVEVASGPVRLLFGTSIASSPQGGTVVGGRFILSHFGHDKPEVALEIPGLDGKSTSAQVLTVSDDGKYAAVSGGAFFGGPAYFFDLSASDYRPIAERTETRNTYRRFRDIFWSLIHRGLAGDPEAPLLLEQLAGMGAVFDALKQYHHQYGSLPPSVVENVEPLITEIVEGLLGPSGTPYGDGFVSLDEEEGIPTVSIDFSPDGKQYVADSIESLAVRDVLSGELNTRIYLTAANGLTPLPVGGHTRFTNAGQHLVSLHRGFQKGILLALWHAEKGFACDQQEIDLEYDPSIPIQRGFTRSPGATHFSISGRSHKGKTTQVWTTDPGEWAQELKMVREFVGGTGKEDMAPPVGFAANGDFAAGLPNGSVELYESDRNRLKMRFDDGHQARVSAVALSRDAKLAASVSAEENTVVLWSVSGEFEPIRLRADSMGLLKSIRFLSDDDSQLILETYQDQVRKVFLLDVYKMRAALANKG